MVLLVVQLASIEYHVGEMFDGYAVYVFHEFHYYLWEDVEAYNYFDGLFLDGSSYSNSNSEKRVHVLAL